MKDGLELHGSEVPLPTLDLLALPMPTLHPLTAGRDSQDTTQRGPGGRAGYWDPQETGKGASKNSDLA